MTLLNNERSVDPTPKDLMSMVIGPKPGSPVDPNAFLWKQHQGGHIRVEKMTTTHIFFSLRMLFNHLVDRESLRIPGCKQWGGIRRWSPDYIRRSTRALLAVLRTRTDLPPNLRAQFDHIVRVCAEHLKPMALDDQPPK